MQISMYRSQFQGYYSITICCFDQKVGIRCLMSVRLAAKGWMSGGRAIKRNWWRRAESSRVKWFWRRTLTPRTDNCLGMFYLAGTAAPNHIARCKISSHCCQKSVFHWPLTCQHDCYGGGEGDCQGCLGHRDQRRRTSYVPSPPKPKVHAWMKYAFGAIVNYTCFS